MRWQAKLRWRFDGEIAAFGTTTGHRVIVGRWPVSPFGPVSDVMLEAPDGTRLLIAPSDEVARFVASCYRFDSVEVKPVEVIHKPGRWDVAALVDPLVRVMLPGVRTRGSAGGGRREWYGAWDSHPLVSVTASWRGTDLGAMTDVFPPVRFGFGSAPRRPAVVRLTTTVQRS